MNGINSLGFAAATAVRGVTYGVGGVLGAWAFADATITTSLLTGAAMGTSNAVTRLVCRRFQPDWRQDIISQVLPTVTTAAMGAKVLSATGEQDVLALTATAVTPVLLEFLLEARFELARFNGQL